MIPSLDQRLALRQRPPQPVVMHQRWEQLLFLHWAFDPALVQASLPAGLQVDTFGDRAWIGLVPFFMRGIRPRFCPAVPGISNFLELNLRTYVHDGAGRPGVWFYSLDCNQPLAVTLARTLFHLPYEHARMQAATAADGTIHYQSQRPEPNAPASRFSYRLQADCRIAEPGSLAFFLAERYLLYARTPRGLRTGRVHHAPYPLADAEVSAWNDPLFAHNGLPSPGRAPDHAMGSPGVAVTVHALTK